MSAMDSLLVVGNWKMHKTAREAEDFVKKLSKALSARVCKHQGIVAGLAVPYTAIRLGSMVANGKVALGAQNVSEHVCGPYTGEISATMLKAEGAEFVLVGHSERRLHYGESSLEVHAKLKRTVEEGMVPVLCVGETLEQKEQKRTREVLQEQIVGALGCLEMQELSRLVIAYEPVWAIGTGKVPDAREVSDLHAFCRSVVRSHFENIPLRILYGGSVCSGNAKGLIQEPEIEGFLVGGASLKVDSFVEIIQIVEAVRL